MTRRVWQLDKHGRPVRLVDVETFYEPAVKTPPTWVCILLAVVFVVGVVWQGGVCW